MKSVLLILGTAALSCAAEVQLPPRPPEAPAGAALVRMLEPLPLEAREAAAVREFVSGNVPDAWRQFVPVTVKASAAGREHTLIMQVAPDVLSLGSNADSLRLPLTPPAAQAAANAAGCLLPTRKMADAIAAAATVRRDPLPLPPGPEMTSFATFVEHDRLLDAQGQMPPGGLVTGGKKDVVLSPAAPSGKVAIYGWHRRDGSVIQPLYTGHTESWVDYSHGIRLVQRAMQLDGRTVDAAEVLADPVLCALLSDEGPVFQIRLDTDRTSVVRVPPDVRLVIKSPPELPPGPLTIALYGTPNGNTAEQTAGRPKVPGDDWHCHIQNIGAQTRWLRAHGLPGLVTVYAECTGLSWPAWRKKHGDASLGFLLDGFRKRWPGRELRFVLTGHSGGGALTFGLLDALPAIPDDVQTIAFLDSNYAYSSSGGHAAKFAEWLKGSDSRRFSVLAYEDHRGLLNGKPFVSESGGTWGRSHAMMHDLAALLPDFHKEETADAITASALGGRVQFHLRRNPERKVLHTVLVEQNGYIRALQPGAQPESPAVRD